MRRLTVFSAVAGLWVSLLVGLSSSARATRAPGPATHPRWATASARVGHAAAGQRRTVRVYLRLRNPDQARAVAAAVSDPHSSAYRHYLTPAQVRARFAPTTATVRTVQRWLRSAGLQTDAVPGNRAYVPATGSTSRLERAFGVTLNRYRVRHQVLVGADRSATVPRSVSASVLALSGLSQSVSRPLIVPPTTGVRNAPPCSAYFGEKTDTTDPTYDGAPLPYVPCGYTPTQVRSAYGLGAVLGHGVDGTGVTVAVVDAFGSPTLRSDATTYAQRNDPSHPLAPGQLIETVAPPTPGLESPDACDAAEWYSEQTLDVEAAHAAAPGATIHYYGAADCQDSALDATLNAIVADGTANVVSNSYGNLGEDVVSDEVAAFGQIAIQAAQEGIGLYFSSGDFGDNARQLGSPAPNFPASNPWVTAVGGTSVQIGADGRRLAQGGWATGRSSRFGGTWSVPSFISGSGGGTSRLYPQPAYQAATVPAALATATRPDGTPGRVVPDIASIADPNTGLLVGQTQTFSDGAYYDQYRVGGTSLAAPVVAATVALADALDGVRHGFVNPALYATVQPAGGIDDVLPGRGGQARIDYVNGENASDGLLTSLRTFDDPGQSIHTAAGYDDVTGLGTLNAAVALALGTVAVTPANATSTAGATQTFTVAATDGFGATVPVAARNVTLSITPAGAATGAQCTADACSATQAGSYTITATYTGTLPTRNGSTLTASTTLTVGPGAAASVAAVGGTPQTATTGVTFAQPLQAAVVDAYGNPVPGTTVTFAIPAASAGSGGATFAGGAATTAAVTNSQGIATSPVVVAGQQTGPIDATATVGTLSADYTLAVTAAGPARADLGVTVRAPAQVKPGQSATLTVTVTNAGPSAATRIGTFVLVPRGWKVTNPGGATQRRGQLLAFTAPSLASRSSLTYTVVLTTAAQRQIAAVAAATLSGTQDPNYRNNAGAAVVTVR